MVIQSIATLSAPRDVAAGSIGKGNLRQLAKGTSIYTAATALNKILLLGIQMILARWLRVAGYGLYSLGLNALVLLQSVALFGLDQSVLRYGALYRNRCQPERMKGILIVALVLGVGASIATAATLARIAPSISATVFHDPTLAPVLELFAVAIPFLSAARITGAFAQSQHDILRMTVIQQLAQPGLNLILLAALFLFQGTLPWAVGAYVVSAAFSAIVGVRALHSIFPHFFTSLRAHVHGMDVLRYSLTLAAISVVYQLFWRAPSLELGKIADTRQVGLYTAAVTLASPPGFVSLVFVQPFLPMMIDLYERRNFRELGELYNTVTRWTQLVVVPSLGILLLFRHPILALFGGDFQSAEGILIPLALAWMVYYAKGPVSAVLDMTGRQTTDLLNVAGVLIVSLGLGAWLIPRHGASGAGWAISISILSWSVAETIESWVCFRFPLFCKDFARALFLAGLPFGCGVALEGRVPILVEAMVVGMLYLPLCYFFGLTQDDRNLLSCALRKILSFTSRETVTAPRS